MPQLRKCLTLLSIALCVNLAGCAHKIQTVDLGCSWTEYITASPDDTTDTKRQILSHDLTRKARCSQS